jgi:hypothetical protein
VAGDELLRKPAGRRTIHLRAHKDATGIFHLDRSRMSRMRKSISSSGPTRTTFLITKAIKETPWAPDFERD